MSDIIFQLLTVDRCFRNNFYDVPDYQREYVWGEKEINQLMEDIYDEYTEDGNKEYFIGSTVTLKKGDSVFDLIDGQQRTTTLFLMLCAFQRVYKSGGLSSTIFDQCLRYTTLNEFGEETPKNRLCLQYMDSNDVIDSIIENTKTKGATNNSGKRLYAALDILKEFLEARYSGDNDGLKKFFIYCFQKVKFIQIETDDVSRALKIFETINERGVGLNSMDLLKNLLFRKVSLEEFPVIKSEWEGVIRLLENRKEKPLRFLRYFVMSNYDVESQKGNDIVREDEIYTWFSKNEPKWSEGGNYHRFLGTLKKNAEKFTDYVHGNKSGVRNIPLENICYLGGSAFRQHLILLLSERNLDLDIFNHLCKQFEALVFVYLITKENARNYEARFSAWAKQLRKVSSKDGYNEFLRSTLHSEYTQRKHDFNVSLNNLSTKVMPAYRVKYILAKLARFVESERIGGERGTSIAEFMGSGFEIEHIAPNNPSEEQAQSLPNYEEHKALLGNLTLLEKPINASIGRGNYIDKIQAYKKSTVYLTKSIAAIEDVGVNTSVNRINRRLKSFDQWDAQAIIDRQKLLTEIALEVWKVELLQPA